MSVIDDADEYYYSLLVLYFPFRDEENIFDGFNSVKEALLSKQDIIRNFDSENNGLILLKKQNEIQMAIDRLTLLEVMEPEIELNTNLTDEQVSVLQAEYIEIEADDNNQGQRIPISQTDLTDRIKELNLEQRSILNIVRQKLLSKENNKAFEIIHGPGGVGKSFLAKVVIDLINLSYDTDKDNLRNHIIIAAPTGVAAKAIGGRTLHNAFSLPIEKYGLGCYIPLTGKYCYIIYIKNTY